jgi:hypothetical protein
MAIKKSSKELKKASLKKGTKKTKLALPKKGVSAELVTPILPLGIMVSSDGANSVAGNVSVTFNSGIGQITASIFRNGLLINLQTISSDGNIFFSDIQSRDGIAVNGVCTGTGGADITISVPTTPTPQHFDTGFIHGLYIVN